MYLLYTRIYCYYHCFYNCSHFLHKISLSSLEYYTVVFTTLMSWIFKNTQLILPPPPPPPPPYLLAARDHPVLLFKNINTTFFTIYDSLVNAMADDDYDDDAYAYKKRLPTRKKMK